ncbi:MAG: hypothetical protein AMXMBFR82_38280 [Candidatus Hydrogenedentota bacterium]
MTEVKPRVAMISSTMLDLPNHRKKVKDACLSRNILPMMMENLPSSDVEAVQVSQEMVEQANVYIGVFAHRYGHVPDGYDVSITELEFDRALERKIPILVFIMHEKYRILPGTVESGAKSKLDSLKKRACDGRVCRTFKSPESLKAEVINALADLERRETTAGLPIASECYPFELLSPDCRLVRAPDSSPDNPFPSWQEYVEQKVPKLKADEIIQERLRLHGWASVLDAASVGKTTLSLRLASAPERRDNPSYYFDLASIAAMDEGSYPLAALRRLAQPGTFLILDNIHHQPELARELWTLWRALAKGSQLLLLATDIFRPVLTAPVQDLAFFKSHSENPSIALRPEPEDLWHIVQYLHERLAGKSHGALPNPPAHVLTRWHRDFRCALGAFCIWAIAGMSEFRQGCWNVSLEATAEWVRRKWLSGLPKLERENLECLAVFGAQEFEIQVPSNALPHPRKLEKLFARDLVSRTQRGGLNPYNSYALREPSWGQLIIAALDAPPDEEAVIFDAALRDPITASILTSRLRSLGRIEYTARLWEHLAKQPILFATRATKVKLELWIHLLRAARDQDKAELAERLWNAWESEPEALLKRAWEAQLHSLAAFVDSAEKHGRETLATLLWEKLEERRDELCERAMETSLEQSAIFLAMARKHGHATLAVALWDAVEKQPNELAKRAVETSLASTARFLATAMAHERFTLVATLWDKLEELEKDDDELSKRVMESPLDATARFLATAMAHERFTLVATLWDKLEELEKDDDELSKRVMESPLDAAAHFLAMVAKGRATLATTLWDKLEKQPDALAQRALETSLEKLAGFLATAKDQERATLVATLWNKLEKHADALADRALEISLEHLAYFLATARNHERATLVETLWDKLEKQPDALAQRALETSLEKLAGFLATAKDQERATLVETLCRSLEEQPAKLASRAREMNTASLAGFLINAPETLAKCAITGFTQADWQIHVDSGRPLVGAAALAQRFGELGRADLQDTIAESLLRRANWRDFGWVDAGIPRVAWLLANIPSTATEAVPHFIDAICTRNWLRRQYKYGATGPIAGGLRELAMHQPPEICQRFHDWSLGLRLKQELEEFANTTPEKRHLTVQLLGSSQLAGFRIPREWLHGLPMDTMGQLPLAALPHRPDAMKVEDWQFNLWLGLRVVASFGYASLLVSPDVVAETLRLWQLNLAETSATPTATANRVNASMVAWLEECVATRDGELAPNQQRLWELSGFP